MATGTSGAMEANTPHALGHRRWAMGDGRWAMGDGAVGETSVECLASMFILSE